MQGMGPARSTKLLERQFFRGLLPVLCRCVILSLTLIASKSYEFPHGRNLPWPQYPLLNDLCNHSCADGPTTFTDRELQPFVHGDRRDQLDFYVDVVAGHDHFSAFGQLHDSSNVSRAEIELWAITIKKGRMTSTFFLCQNISLSVKFRVRRNAARFGQNLAALHFLSLGAAEQNADIVARLTLVQTACGTSRHP